MKKISKIFFVFAFSLFSICMAAEKKSLTAAEYFQQGKEHQQNENWFSACESYLETVHANPDFGEAWFNLAECSFQLDEYELTLGYLENAEKYFRNDPKILNLRGMTYISQGKLTEAREVFDKVLERFPNDVNARFGQAELFLLKGKFSAAEEQYNQALYRDATNRKALLSLAILMGQLGRFEKAQVYMQKALNFYSGEADVYYYSAILYAMAGDYSSAEKRARMACEINPESDRIYELLSNILFRLEQYEEVINLCDFRINHDRNKNTAWFLKGLSYLKMGNREQAIANWSSGLEIVPVDEIMRAALENLIKDNVDLEDSRRKVWALYHVNNAREYGRRYDTAGTTYEYQRALKIDPMNDEARLNFANMLKLNDFNELYLEQLKFIKENSENQKASTEIEDTIEAYDSLLTDTLSTRWRVQPFFMDKTRYNIGLFYQKSESYTLHVQNNRTASEFASDMFTGVAETNIRTLVKEVKGFGDAYRTSRENKLDFFVILNLDEGLRDVTLTATVYAGRTGTNLKEIMLYSTGNNRYSSVFRRFRKNFLEMLPVRGKILNRRGKTVLIDLGKTEHIVNGAKFDIVKKGCVQTASSSSALTYKESDKLGTLTVTNAGEEISEGEMEFKGFYDKVNSDDEIVLVFMPEEKTEQPADLIGIAETSPQADRNGEPVNKTLTAEDLGITQTPSFIDLIRGIY